MPLHSDVWVDGKSWTVTVQLGKLPAPLSSRFPGLDAASESVIAGQLAIRTAQRLGFFFLETLDFPGAPARSVFDRQ